MAKTNKQTNKQDKKTKMMSIHVSLHRKRKGVLTAMNVLLTHPFVQTTRCKGTMLTSIFAYRSRMVAWRDNIFSCCHHQPCSKYLSKVKNEVHEKLAKIISTTFIVNLRLGKLTHKYKTFK